MTAPGVSPGRARLLLRGGRVIDPLSRLDERGLDLLLADGVVARLGHALPDEGAEVVDASHLIVVPGFIDMHVHLREPGDEEAETVHSGCQAAAAGGFTAVAAMANTRPVNDVPAETERLLQRAAEARQARVWPVAAVSRGLEGRELTDFAALKAAGAVAVSDDGRPVASAGLMRAALLAAERAGLLVIDHCEEPSLAPPGWAMNQGLLAERLGLRGMDPAGEEIAVARDAALARSSGRPVHVAHVSTRDAVERLREEKARGTRITAEAAPHHFLLTEEEVERQGTNAKMNPPLRTAADVAALCRALADGTIDCIATDHAPHPHAAKARAFAEAPNGVVGLETAVSLALDGLVHTGRLGIGRLVELMSVNPARILGVPGGSLAPGAPADVTVLDLAAVVEVDPARFRSRSRNTPFAGRRLRGRAVITIVGGRMTWDGR